MEALIPPEMARKAEQVGVAKASLDTLSTLLLAVLAGAFIALGALFMTVVTAGTAPPTGPVALLGGLAFSLGLILVVVAGAELFTGNNLIVMAWASGRVPTLRLCRNWTIVYAGNFLGAAATALLVSWTKVPELLQGAVGQRILAIATAKGAYTFRDALASGMLANALVCLAVWLTYSARTTTDRILAIVFPITAFVAAGLEHSIANMYFFALSMLVHGAPDWDAFLARMWVCP
ncbi:MAG: formate/nitrite transporter family protein [Planctomycetaceae bacterium]